MGSSVVYQSIWIKFTADDQVLMLYICLKCEERTLHNQKLFIQRRKSNLNILYHKQNIAHFVVVSIQQFGD